MKADNRGREVHSYALHRPPLASFPVSFDSTLLIVIAGAAVAGFVQGLSGFAFGMVAMSFWAWAIEPRLAAAMTVFGALTGQLLAAASVRRGLSWRRLWPFVAGGVAGIPLGVAVLPLLDAQWFKAVLGAFLTLWCPVMLMVRRLPHIGVGGRVADGVAGAAGGVMGGIGGFTGVIPTLWCTLRGFDKDEQRAVIQNFNLATLAMTMAAYVGKGIVTREMLPMFLVVAPAMLVPTLLGTRLYLGISEAAFRKIVLTLLTVSGVALLATSVPVLVARGAG
nr:sulfite exporter TauE/SafE family protein [Cupriavidus alkaliphilus]